MEWRRWSRDRARCIEREMGSPMSDMELERMDSAGTDKPTPRYDCDRGEVVNSAAPESQEVCGSEADSIGMRREDVCVEEWGR